MAAQDQPHSSATDVVLILGAQNDLEGNLSDMGVERAMGGLQEYRNRPGAKLLLTSGYGHFNRADLPHAHYVAQFLLGRGVPQHDILPFVNSVNTVEDAVFAKRVLEAMSIRSICVVTSCVHVRRAQLIFEHFFGPELLEFVGTPNGVSGERLERHEIHEAKAFKTILDQGGVFFDGKLHARKASQ